MGALDDANGTAPAEAREAVTSSVTNQARYVAAIEEGLADWQAGRVISDDQLTVMLEQARSAPVDRTK